MNLDFTPLISGLTALPPEAVLLANFTFLMLSAIALIRLFGLGGGYLFMALAMILGNIQVLKVVQMGIFADPVAMGTEFFAASYLCTDILTEKYGKHAAYRGVWIGFAGFLFFTIAMFFGLGYSPLTPAQAGEGFSYALGMNEHLSAIFLPMPVFFVAGVAAYLTSQLLDVTVYDWLRRKTNGKHMWVRNNTATITASLIDNTVFSLLAFSVLAAQPVPTDALIYTYILGTFYLRVFLALFDTPFLYLGMRILRKAP
jgi:queuosine precursor transporter